MEQTLTFIDIIALATAAIAVFIGWRSGLISQITSLLGFVCAIWLAGRYGGEVGTLLHFTPAWRVVGGFFIVLFLALIGASLLGWLVSRIFSLAGLGCLDALLGAFLALIKWAVLIGAIFTAFSAINKHVHLVEEETLRRSLSFDAYCLFSETVMPSLKQKFEEIPWEEFTPEKPQTDGAE